MGKVRSKKCSKIARSDPTGLEKTDGDEEVEASPDLGPVSGFVQTLMEQLQSHLAEERDSGLNSLSAGSSKPAYLEEIIKTDDLIKVVAPLLLDPSVSVRHSAAGALRNLSSIGMEVCDRMVSADVMTPLITLLKQACAVNRYYDVGKYSSEWVPQSKEKKCKHPLKIDSSTEAFIEAVTLLWNLCEAGETAVKIFNQEKLGDLLSRFLNVDTYGIRVSVCTALCLYSATEDNKDALANQALLEECLIKICMSRDKSVEAWQFLYLQTAAAGIIVNFHKGDLRGVDPDKINIILRTLNASLEMDHILEVNKFSSDVPVKDGNHVEMYHREKESDLQKLFELDDKCEAVMALVSSQLMSLEILSNIIISDEDALGEDDDDSGESIEEEFGDDMNDEEDVEMKDIYSDNIPSEVYESLSSTGMVAKVLSKIKSLPVNVGQILKEDESHGQKLLRKCTILRSTALICLQNLIEVLNLADLEKCLGIGDLWTGLGSTLTECDNADVTMIEALTSAMRAVIQTIVNQKVTHAASSQLCVGFTIFHQVYEAVNICKVRVNVIKIIGCVGLLLSRLPKETAVNDVNVEILITQIAEHLLGCILSLKLEQEGLWLAAEILDTLFDVFAEDDYNYILKKVGLAQKLKVLQPIFKKQVRNERRSLGENMAIIQTANTNLPRFIQYKEKHGA